MPAAVARKITPQEQDHKQVRFEESKPPPTSTTTSCVSKRGRYVSPGRRNTKLPESVPSEAASEPEEEKCSASLLLSPKSTEKRFAAPTTPTTDFSVDFGSSKGFDPNVLAWLQSPSGLFSPGFGTPSKATTPTPVVSTSFFFSDVANLPKGNTDSNIICISPLASSKEKSTDWKEVFASPEAKVSAQPVRKGVDAVLSAEQDVREDEDLSVLMQLASNTTPGKKVFRKDDNKKDLPPSIPLPTATDSSTKVKLYQKSSSRSEEIVPVQLGMRKNSKSPYGYPLPDIYGSMRVSIGNGKAPPPSPKQPYPPYPHHQPPPYYYHQGPQPYGYPVAHPPPPPQSEPQHPPPPKKKAKTTATKTAETDAPNIEENSSQLLATATKSGRKRGSPKKKNKSPQLKGPVEREKAASTIRDLNAAAGGKNDKAAALAAAILRGVTMRPSGKWQAQLYFSGKSRYIGVFDSREKAALAYEIAREKLKTGAAAGESTEELVNAARKAAFDGVNEQLK